MVKNSSASARDTTGTGSIPGSGRYPGGGHGNPLQYSCPENLMDRGAWQTAVHRVTQLKQLVTSQTQLKELVPEDRVAHV